MNKILFIIRNLLIVFLLLSLVFCKTDLPTIIITSPPYEGYKYFVDENIHIKVIIADCKKQTPIVQLYDNDKFIEECSAAPYHFTIKAGVLTPGAHTIRIVAKTKSSNEVELKRMITILNYSSVPPDFVTFKDGIIPPQWEINNWSLFSNEGVDDTWSLFSVISEATVVAPYIECNKIEFYLRGYGEILFSIDNKLREDIILYDSLTSSAQEWRPYVFTFPTGLHTFRWIFYPHFTTTSFKYGGLDAIRFSKNN